MENISLERKLELVRTIRERQDDNFEQMRKREKILYGKESYSHPISSLDSANAPAFLSGSFKLRLFLSIVLFLLFFFMDIYQYHYHILSSSFIVEKVSETFSVNSFDFISQFPYTLEE
ncbi:MAG: hypothetical protein ACI39N_08175 [Lachnospiraceae bacterium]